MKKKIVLLSVVFFITTSLFFLNKTIEYNLKSPQFYTNDKEELRIIDEMDKIASKSVQQKKIKNVILYDLNGKGYRLKELIGEGPNKLVVRFSETQCSYCIEHILNCLKKFINKRGVNNILLIGDFANKHSFSVFVRLNKKMQINVYSIDKLNFGLAVDNLDLPYLFVTNKKLRPLRVFVPLKEIPKRTQDYFEKTIKYFEVGT